MVITDPLMHFFPLIQPYPLTFCISMISFGQLKKEAILWFKKKNDDFHSFGSGAQKISIIYIGRQVVWS